MGRKAAAVRQAVRRRADGSARQYFFGRSAGSGMEDPRRVFRTERNGVKDQSDARKMAQTPDPRVKEERGMGSVKLTKNNLKKQKKELRLILLKIQKWLQI